ncbi:MAG: LarC family nickel insertion protein [Geminicoccaceae bacterium]
MKAPLHVHLDPAGGIAGDMFVAALLDAWPSLANGAIGATRAAGLGEEVQIEHRPHKDEVLVGSRFSVTREGDAAQGHAHDHVHWRDLRERLSNAPLSASVRERAIAIFAHLAEAEAYVHGVEVDAATFHEVGAWDSIADIVAAAFLIEAIGAESWSVGPLPLGGGRVRCAHGELPVPAPATVRLLEGFSFHDDGRSGERVTPTGAAILKQIGASNPAPSRARRLLRTGHGFGLRKLDGMSNVLRALVFEASEDAGADPAGSRTDRVAVLTFEIDDQTPEDLAIGLDRLRAEQGVLDLVQMPVFGKKGRLATALRLLARPEAAEAVIAACFAETTTLGVRWHVEERAILARTAVKSDDEIGVKLAERPGGRTTVKAESADIARIGGHAEREAARRSAEGDALARRSVEDDE